MSSASPKPNVFVRNGVKEKLKLGSRGLSASMACLAAERTSVAMVTMESGEVRDEDEELPPSYELVTKSEFKFVPPDSTR